MEHSPETSPAPARCPAPLEDTCPVPAQDPEDIRSIHALSVPEGTFLAADDEEGMEPALALRDPIKVAEEFAVLLGYIECLARKGMTTDMQRCIDAAVSLASKTRGLKKRRALLQLMGARRMVLDGDADGAQRALRQLLAKDGGISLVWNVLCEVAHYVKDGAPIGLIKPKGSLGKVRLAGRDCNAWVGCASWRARRDWPHVTILPLVGLLSADSALFMPMRSSE